MKRTLVVALVIVLLSSFSLFALETKRDLEPGFYIKPVGEKEVKITIVGDWVEARRFRAVLQSDGYFKSIYPRSIETAAGTKLPRLQQNFLKIEGTVKEKITFRTQVSCGNWLKFRLELDVDGDGLLGVEDWKNEKIFWYNYSQCRYFKTAYFFKFKVSLPFHYCCYLDP